MKDMNPMMSIVGGDFTGQAAATAAALGVQPGTLIATNTNNLYGFAHIGGLQQQLLQQTAAVFQNYTEAMDNDPGIALMSGVGGTSVAVVDDGEQQQVYGQLEDGYDDASGAVDGGAGNMSDLEPKQEIINIDDFVMMNEDNNSYDGTDFMTSSDKDISQSSSSCMTSLPTNHDLLMPLGDGLMQQQKQLLLGAPTTTVTTSSSSGGDIPFGNNLIFANTSAAVAAAAACGESGQKSLRTGYNVSGSGKAGASSSSSSSSTLRSQRKTRKIEPVNRPGLVLKTPIAYKGNIDPSVIPIQKDGMGMFSIFLQLIFHYFHHYLV